MLKESNVLRKIVEKKEVIEGISFEKLSRSSLDTQALECFEDFKKKDLGFSYAEARNSSILISGSHAADLVESNIKATKENIQLLNQEAGNIKSRYGISARGNLTLGKQYDFAFQRERGEYKADTNVENMNIEMWKEMLDREADSRPGIIFYEMPQIYSEPNKVDAKNKGTEVIGIGIYDEIGANKLVEYIKLNGVDGLSSRDIYFLRMGKYDQLAIFENDISKKEAFLECNEIVGRLDKKNEVYKKVIASLGVLKMHRSYFEKQEELLYQKGKVKRPINLEIHTCFDTIKKEENIDLIIGTRQSSSVAEPEMEYLFGLFLKEKGYKVGFSTLNTFPDAEDENRKKSLNNFIETGLRVGLFDNQEINKIMKVDNNEEEAAVRFEETVVKRLKNIFSRENGRESVIKYLKTVLNKDFSGEGMTNENLSDTALSEYLKGFSKLSLEDKNLKLKQELANLSFSERLETDRLRDGLNGLSSLDSKFKARKKYPLSDGQFSLPAIFQIEIVQSIMLDGDKRKLLQRTFAEFAKLVEKKDFDPQKELQKLI